MCRKKVRQRGHTNWLASSGGCVAVSKTTTALRYLTATGQCWWRHTECVSSIIGRFPHILVTLGKHDARLRFAHVETWKVVDVATTFALSIGVGETKHMTTVITLDNSTDSSNKHTRPTNISRSVLHNEYFMTDPHTAHHLITSERSAVGSSRLFTIEYMCG